MSKIKRIDIKEFREKGFLQEANRMFFHPLGLALEIEISDDGTESLGGVWDYRHDPEGMLFSEDAISSDDANNKKRNVDRERANHSENRVNSFGFIIQPVGKP